MKSRFNGWSAMNCRHRLTSSSNGISVQIVSLTMMYEAVRGALAADNALKAEGKEARFRVRETSRRHAADLEVEFGCADSPAWRGPGSGPVPSNNGKREVWPSFAALAPWR